MATAEEIRGNIHHNVQPVLGWVRMALHDEKPLTLEALRAVERKLSTTLEEADKLSTI